MSARSVLLCPSLPCNPLRSSPSSKLLWPPLPWNPLSPSSDFEKHKLFGVYGGVIRTLPLRAMVRWATNAEAGAVARPSAFALFMQDMKVQGLSPRRISQDGRCRLTKKTPLKGMEHYRLRWHLTLSNPVNLVDCCTCQSFFTQLLLTIYQMTPQAFALQTAILFCGPLIACFFFWLVHQQD